MVWLRVGMVCGGIVILAFLAHTATMEAGGGYGWHAGAVTPWMAALGVALGTVCAAWSLRDGRVALAIFLGICVSAAEIYALINNSERLLTTRDARSAPFRAAEEAHAKGQERLRRAKAAVDSWPESSPRIEAAVEARNDAQAKAVEASSGQHCNRICGATIAAGLIRFDDEVRAAREHHQARRASAEAEWKAAKEAADGAPRPISQTTLAGVLGLPGWFGDLFSTGAGALGANGIALGLLAFGAHGSRKPKRREDVPRASKLLPPESEQTTRSSKQATSSRKPAALKKQVVEFFLAKVERASSESEVIPVGDIAKAYRSWAIEAEIEPMQPAEFISTMTAMMAKSGVAITKGDDGKYMLLGLSMKSGSPASKPLVAQN